MAQRPLPPPDVPVVDPQSGLITQAWFEYFFQRDQLKLTELKDVSTTAPANTEVLIWNSATKLWEPGAN